jgi:hypothetical protein
MIETKTVWRIDAQPLQHHRFAYIMPSRLALPRNHSTGFHFDFTRQDHYYRCCCRTLRRFEPTVRAATGKTSLATASSRQPAFVAAELHWGCGFQTSG